MTQFMTVTGLKKLQLKLDRMPVKTGKKAVKKGVDKGALMMKREIKATVKQVMRSGPIPKLIAKMTAVHKPKRQKSGMGIQ